jgi:8-oxo-dGTP pyrophosphatase MutT (NUDIX family)
VSDSQPGPVDVGPWRRRTRTVAYANPWIELRHDEVDRPDGSPGIYGVVHFRNAAVGVVAVDDAGRILLVGQHRYTLDAYSWELPEGGAPLGEDPLDGAKRELAEETGYEAATWAELARFSLSNSITDERGVLYLATGLRAGAATPEPTEDLAIRWATLPEVVDEIGRGEIHDILTIAGVTRYALQLRDDQEGMIGR